MNKIEILNTYLPDVFALPESVFLQQIKREIEDPEEFLKALKSEGLVFEPKQGYIQRVKEKKTEAPTKPKGNAPLMKEYYSLGEGKGISATVWENNVQLQRQEKIDGKWEVKQEINLAKPILEKLFVRIPVLYNRIKIEEDKE
ncbi:MAG: hypothetical protein J4428_03755 [Candidatus Aenigmarchaeota archaeon]|nr:hypothetical protein [Candidatus Aenigmarchaeota archaeon]